MLDVNLNRCREALRLTEDYARFALDDGGLCGALKSIRHDLTAATRAHSEAAVLWRDTPGDVGTRISTETEAQRRDLAHVVVAAGKRFGEACRAVEELLKTIDPASAATVEACRYRFYAVEKEIARTLSPRDGFTGVRLYLILTEAACRRDWLATAEACLATGQVDCLQLREPDLPSGELLARARRLRDLCRDAKATFIVNDRPDIALLSKADGVHVGQGDLPAAEARKIVGPRAILGVSTHHVEQVKQARRDGATYVGVGPVYPSTTKPRDFLPGLAFARAAAELRLLPTVAIAGITPENVGEVWQTGISAVAVASAVTMQDGPAAVISHLCVGASVSP